MNAPLDNLPISPDGVGVLRRLWRWRVFRIALFSLACLVALVVLFYAEEDWRGLRAWQECKNELLAKGLVLDWKALIPPTVPDAQNIFKAPGIIESNWVGRGYSDLYKRIAGPLRFSKTEPKPLCVAQVKIAPTTNAPTSTARHLTLRLADANSADQATNWIFDVLGPLGGSANDSTFIASPLDQIHPLEITVLVDGAPTSDQIASLFPEEMKLSADAEFTKIYIESNGPAAFRVLLIQPPVAAADFVNYCKALQPDLDTIRAALKRPYARLDGDYSQPDEIPIPNIDSLYIITRTLAGEAACHWLLHQSDEALNDLTLLHNSCRVLEGRPTGKPMTIRGAMADVNINGLYAKTVANGLRARAWNASQLAALQQQLAEIDLLPIVHEAFVEERVAKIFTLETHNSADLAAIFYATIEGTKPRSWWDLRKEPVSLIIACCPRGWLYQNLKAASSIMEATIASCDPAQHLVYPSEANRVVPEIRALRFGFPSALAIAEVFEILGADGDWKITSHNQTLINQEMIVCALERFHLENRNYPESLDALAPRFLNKIPPDVIGGRTPRYRRLENGQFLLYSTGWDEKDHGGKSSPPDADSDSPEGDVVWEPN